MSAIHSMRRMERDVLREQHTYLLDNVIVDMRFCSMCISSALFTPDYLADHILLLRSPAEKLNKILESIPKRGPEAFGIFIDILEKTGQNHAAQKLQQSLSARKDKVDVNKVPGPPKRTMALELPPYLRGKAFEIYEKMRKIYSKNKEFFDKNEDFDIFSETTITFDDIESIIDALLVSFDFLCGEFRQCKLFLKNAGIKGNVAEGVAYVITLWREEEIVSQMRKADLEKYKMENDQMQQENGRMDYEIKVLKDKETLLINSLRDAENDLRDARKLGDISKDFDMTKTSDAQLRHQAIYNLKSELEQLRERDVNYRTAKRIMELEIKRLRDCLQNLEKENKNFKSKIKSNFDNQYKSITSSRLRKELTDEDNGSLIYPVSSHSLQHSNSNSVDLLELGLKIPSNKSDGETSVTFFMDKKDRQGSEIPQESANKSSYREAGKPKNETTTVKPSIKGATNPSVLSNTGISNARKQLARQRNLKQLLKAPSFQYKRR
ncbi:hypothetical protein FSP39_001948 [Pinctada imbricata]|uniref:CARD domain-containing protein n=1 Tax=Pinctada imbricata TaxID=66713 RepID=A0AA88YLL3_PINIB|nr:hypothetical protein FSP39_001948 [Pinctada imbricata]